MLDCVLSTTKRGFIGLPFERVKSVFVYHFLQQNSYLWLSYHFQDNNDAAQLSLSYCIVWHRLLAPTGKLCHKQDAGLLRWVIAKVKA